MCVFFFKQKTAYEMRISDWSSDVCSSDLKNEAQERHFENAGGYRNKGADSGDDMPKGNRPLAVRRKPPVQLFNVVFGQGDPSAVNPCPTRQPFQSQPPRKSVPEQRTGKRTRRTRTNDSRHVEIAVGHKIGRAHV